MKSGRRTKSPSKSSGLASHSPSSDVDSIHSKKLSKPPKSLRPSKESSYSSRNHSTLSIFRGYERSAIARRRYTLFNSAINELEDGHSSHITDSRRFISMALLTSTMMTAEIVFGVITGSLTLLSDALHMASDLIALIIGYMAHRKANNVNEDSDTFEHAMVYMRYEIIGALINGTILLTSCFIMGLEAIQRITFHHGEIENVDLVLIVGGLGLVINLIGLCIFGHHGHHHGHSHDHEEEQNDGGSLEKGDNEHAQDDAHNAAHHHGHGHGHGHHHHHHEEERNLNIHGVFLHILGDLLGSVAVMVSALVIKLTEGWWTIYIDPVCTLFIVMLISKTAWPLVKQSANMLLGKSPLDPSILDELNQELQAIPGVLNVHELHCWEVKTGYVMATLHFVVDPMWEDQAHSDKYCRDECDILHDKMTIIDRSKQILHRYGIHSSIVQTEFPAKGDLDWKKGDVPCFDYVCEQKECIKKGKALSNEVKRESQSPSKLKNRVSTVLEVPESQGVIELSAPNVEEVHKGDLDVECPSPTVETPMNGGGKCIHLKCVL